MIPFWNRFEVYVGFDRNRFNAILDRLAAENIKYKFRTVWATGQNPRSSSRPGGSIGINQDYAIMYYIYVHKKDADLARWLLQQR